MTLYAPSLFASLAGVDQSLEPGNFIRMIVAFLIAFLVTLTMSALRRPRWSLAVLFGVPALLWIAFFAFVAVDAASPCGPEGNCWYGMEYGVAMVFVAAAVVSLSWLAGGGLGWLIGWLLSRRGGHPRA
jgi:hypothetical protein